MKKIFNLKGFTLVEMLAVIVILGIIALITVPIALGIIDRGKEDMYNNQILEIKEAATMYVVDHGTTDSELSQVGVQHIVTLAELSSLGYIDLPIKNPITGVNFNASIFEVEIIRQSNGTFTYQVGETGIGGSH